MNLDLTELAATLAIGVFSAVGVGFVLMAFSERTFPSIVNAVSNTNQYVIGVVVAFCFGIGMIIEDVSNKFVDDDTWLNRSGVLQSDDEIKAKVFFGDNYRQKIHDAPLAYIASRYGLLGRYAGADGKALEGHILEANQCLAIDETQRFQSVQLAEKTSKNVAKLFYYNAKASSYQDPSYYNELKRIQMRIDFSRSLIAVSVLLTILFIMMSTVSVLYGPLIWFRTLLLSRLSREKRQAAQWIKTWAEKKHHSLQKSEAERKPVSVRKIRVLGFFVGVGLIFFAANFAYSSEEEEFNKRAYGYYIYSKINSEKNAASEICRESLKPPGGSVAASSPPTQ